MREARDWEERMEASGCWPEVSAWVRAVMVGQVPRHRFAPDVVWVWDGRAWVGVERGAEPRRWAAAVYGGPYESTVTQVLDGLPSSSLSCGSVVADMLDSLTLRPGDRVLELGTGSGWNAALLAARAGVGCVVSVEVDAGLAADARGRLDSARLGVDVHTGDGAAGWADGAPYDRVIATYAVDVVPWAWVAQARPGGRIVTPWGRLGHVALTVADDGQSASGWVQGLATFMPSRGVDQGVEWGQIPRDGGVETEGSFPFPVGELGDGNLLFALRVLSPDVRITVRRSGDGATAQLHDGRASWAVLTDGVAVQGGPRRLADEVSEGWLRWGSAGRPSLYDFGITRTPSEQYVWHEGADGVRQRWEPTAPTNSVHAADPITSTGPASTLLSRTGTTPGTPSATSTQLPPSPLL